MLDTTAELDTARSRLALILGDPVAAAERARVAIDVLDPTEWLPARGYAWWRLADARLALEDRDGAREAATTAIGRFEEKGDVSSAAKVRRLLATIG